MKMVLICSPWTVRIVPERSVVSRKFIVRFTRNSFVLFLLTQNSCFHSTSTQPKILTNYYSQYCSAFPSFTITESQHFWFSFYSCSCSSWNYFCATFPIHKIFYSVDWIKDKDKRSSHCHHSFGNCAPFLKFTWHLFQLFSTAVSPVLEISLVVATAAWIVAWSRWVVVQQLVPTESDPVVKWCNCLLAIVWVHTSSTNFSIIRLKYWIQKCKNLHLPGGGGEMLSLLMRRQNLS